MTGICPLALRPDATGCDRDCGLPEPEGFWAWLWYKLAGWSRCTSGIDGCGDGSLPCERLDRFMKENK